MTLKSLKETLKNIISWIKKPNINWNTADTGERYYRVVNTSDEGVWFGYGNGRVNHGIWSEKMNRWMVNSNGTQTYIDGKDPFDSSKQSTGTLPGARLPVIFKTVSNTCATFTLNAGSSNYKNITLSIPDGYDLIGPIGVTSSHNQAVNVGGLYRANNGSISVTFRNNSGANLTDMTFTVYGLCALYNTW